MIRTSETISQVKVVEGYKQFQMLQTRAGLRLASDMINNPTRSGTIY